MPDLIKLEQKYFRPFDTIYAIVTEGMKAEAEGLPPPDQDWLETLIVEFQRERDQWNERPELDAYRIQWARFRTRLLRLAAGAYLHISYDLPRTIADNWPETAQWAGGPNRLQAMAIYAQVEGVFPASLSRATQHSRVVGLYNLVLSRLPKDALGAIEHWILTLRNKAWTHADVLANFPGRAQREQTMATAMAEALRDATDRNPLKVYSLKAPDKMLRSPFWATLAAAWSALNDAVPFIPLAVMLAYITSVIYRTRMVRDASKLELQFIHDFGRRLEIYMEAAVREPETFERFLSTYRASEGRSDGDLGTAYPI